MVVPPEAARVILTFLLFALLVLRRHRDTPAGYWLHLVLVERPAAALVGWERRHWIALVVLAGLCLAGAAGVTGELAWVLALDSSLYLDLILTVGSASVLRATRTGWSVARTSIRQSTRRVGARPRARRTPRPAAPGRAANDDGEARHAA